MHCLPDPSNSRQHGIDVNEIRSSRTSHGEAFWVSSLTHLSGKQVGRLPYERMDPQVLDSPPTTIHNIPQPDFEELLPYDEVQSKQFSTFDLCAFDGLSLLVDVESATHWE
ncbi:hypothetical protein BO70DRAFT_430022 [Aspergillus heteromorphus CBS 117.55]|uniref:Uncharacterized protein n=1 Tax=Aspergillus heteromorphus CBS 117.55 TaxID=1448321 RepID=A0A317VY63_9EURO|nr:uncharacterized protein BO70DRAFT_430022 [Aspergillus heteromorphus CBS 117.55]PWY79223.1 hypothetical protein BO70DRAFT_430022 [Aspergillus heteromorphus CBS 117.55]